MARSSSGNRGKTKVISRTSQIKSRGCSLSPSNGTWTVRDNISGKIVSKSTIADGLISKYDKTFKELSKK